LPLAPAGFFQRAVSAMDHVLQALSIDYSAARYGLVLLATLIAGLTDALWFRIYNALTIPVLLGGIAYHAFAPDGAGIWFALGGALMGLVILIVLFARGGVAAGDVKLLTAIGSWIGAHDVMVVFVITGLCVGAYSAVVRLRNRRDSSDSTTTPVDQPRPTVDDFVDADIATKRRRVVPMAAMMAIGLVTAVVLNFWQGRS